MHSINHYLNHTKKKKKHNKKVYLYDNTKKEQMTNWTYYLIIFPL